MEHAALANWDTDNESPCAEIKISRADHRSVNDGLHALGLVYHHSIPLNAIVGVFPGAVRENVRAALAGIWCGREGKEVIPFAKHSLVVSWYKMPSGRYEIVSYLS
jgi:hypothetical protein